MKQAIILHGTTDKEEYFDSKHPSLSNSHWLPWLQKQLLMAGWVAHTPEVAQAYEPTYDKWLAELNRYALDENTTLIGHSCGAGFLVRFLSENPDVRLDKVILVAPWLDPERKSTTSMFDFDIDPAITNRANKLTLFHSTDDFSSIQESVELIRNNIPGIQYREFDNKGHFVIGAMKTDAFPELLSLVVS